LLGLARLVVAFALHVVELRGAAGMSILAAFCVVVGGCAVGVGLALLVEHFNA
jgi:hypothetical protein